MGHCEDFYYDIVMELEKLELTVKFEKQLLKMNTQDKHKHKDTRARWSYAYDKIIKKSNTKNGS
tara:strand:- start:1191 stop:1382 length:192 start_codon:yes stop_codon:yes gene_type:complete